MALVFRRGEEFLPRLVGQVFPEPVESDGDGDGRLGGAEVRGDVVVARIDPRAPADEVAKLLDGPVAVGAVGVDVMADDQVHHPALHAAGCSTAEAHWPCVQSACHWVSVSGADSRISAQRRRMASKIPSNAPRPVKLAQGRQLVATGKYSTFHSIGLSCRG